MVLSLYMGWGVSQLFFREDGGQLSGEMMWGESLLPSLCIFFEFSLFFLNDI